jgi:multidrug efflux pump subunit AcrA (membrane-fusion protein)
LQPAVRSLVFADVSGQVMEVLVKHGQIVAKGQPLARMTSSDLEVQIFDAQGKLDTALEQIISLSEQLSRTTDRSEEADLRGQRKAREQERKSAEAALKLLKLKQEQLTIRSPIDGQVNTWHVHDLLISRPVKLGDVLMTIVEPRGDWELELQMPENRMGFINDARAEMGPDLPVEYITATNPAEAHLGTIKEIHQRAEVRGEEGNTVLIQVAIDKNDVPDKLPGADVTAQVSCGRASIGYVWFHDLVSFVQSKILFRLM